MNRRQFVLKALVATAAANTGFAANEPSAPLPAGHKRPSPIETSLVANFVSAAHSDLVQVKSMLDQEPKLIHADYDWGAGDWETALGAASHMGATPIAEYLISRGARIDTFCAAMLGVSDVLESLVRFAPSVVNVRGPHGYSLMYHIGYNGKVSMAERVAPNLTSRSRDFNQALHSATNAGHVELVRWLLKNGVSNVNTKDNDTTPLELAIQLGREEIAKILRDQGGNPLKTGANGRD